MLRWDAGEQWQSWIHIEDIAGIYLFLLKNQLEGKYNAVAPNPVQNKKMTKMIASKLETPLWLPNIPAFVIKLLLGEMSVLVLEGQLVSSHKIEELGYQFKFYNLENCFAGFVVNKKRGKFASLFFNRKFVFELCLISNQ